MEAATPRGALPNPRVSEVSLGRELSVDPVASHDDPHSGASWFLSPRTPLLIPVLERSLSPAGFCSLFTSSLSRLSVSSPSLKSLGVALIS